MMDKDSLPGRRQPETQPLSQRQKIAIMFVAYLAVTMIIWLLLPDRYLPEISLWTMIQFLALISAIGLGSIGALWASGVIFRALTRPLKAKNDAKPKRKNERLLRRSDGEVLEITEVDTHTAAQFKDKRS